MSTEPRRARLFAIDPILRDHLALWDPCWVTESGKGFDIRYVRGDGIFRNEYVTRKQVASLRYYR